MYIKYPDLTKGLEEQNDDVLLGMVIYGEARGASFDAKIGVACVIKNRIMNGHFYDGNIGNNYSGVILKHYQFSSLNKNDPNRKKLFVDPNDKFSWDDILYENCYLAGQLVKLNIVSDVTGGALFYFSYPLTNPPLVWGQVVSSADIDKLHFYKNKFL